MIRKPAFIQRRPDWHFQLRLQIVAIGRQYQRQFRLQVDWVADQGKTGTPPTELPVFSPSRAWSCDSSNPIAEAMPHEWFLTFGTLRLMMS